MTPVISIFGIVFLSLLLAGTVLVVVFALIAFARFFGPPARRPDESAAREVNPRVFLAILSVATIIFVGIGAAAFIGDNRQNVATPTQPQPFTAVLPASIEETVPSAWDPVINDTVLLDPFTSRQDAVESLALRLTTLIEINPTEQPASYRVVSFTDHLDPRHATAQNDTAIAFAKAFQRINHDFIRVEFTLAPPAQADSDHIIQIVTGRQEQTGLKTISLAMKHEHGVIALSNEWTDAPWFLPDGDIQQCGLIEHPDGTTTLHGIYRTPRLAATKAEALDEAFAAAAADLGDRYAASENTRKNLQQTLHQHLHDTSEAISNVLTQTISRHYGQVYRTAVEIHLDLNTILDAATQLEQRNLDNDRDVKFTWFAVIALAGGIFLVYILLNIATQGYFGYTLTSVTFILIALAFGLALLRHLQTVQ
ncbi:hypothetical protein [Mucisphaera calidilacus]|uniref:Uncharacterized protein n=1 Tax=Mucisphaera calidilacus TaxID=2527982 RepID=A0A518BWC7_9BACT|nr:hypothetical protein [Mucisphaera calidilacus]QDU71261.1 hypothetical protein Pan265_11100 [Mucisphaera calidilacus]